MLGDSRPQQNHLWNMMPVAVRNRLAPYLEPVQLPQEKVLYDVGNTALHVYFPTSAVVSLLCAMDEDTTAHIALIGNEGLIGIALVIGGDTTPNRAVVQIPGAAYRLSGQRMKDEFNRDSEVLVLFLRYSRTLLVHMEQSAACSRHHTIDQQLCRWLLLLLDRLPSNESMATQESIAGMLGVAAERVAGAAGRLKDLGVIEYGNGRISVLDRPRLEQLSCGCSKAVSKEVNRLFPNP